MDKDDISTKFIEIFIIDFEIFIHLLYEALGASSQSVYLVCGNHQILVFLWKPPILVFFVETTNIGEISEKPITVIGNHSNLLSNARLGRDFILWTPLAVANKLFAPTWWTSKLN